MPKAQKERRLILETTPALCSHVDAEGRYAYANEAYRAWFGVDPAQLIGRRFVDFVGAEAYEVLRPAIEIANAGSPMSLIETMSYGGRSGRTINIQLRPDHSGGHIAIVNDVSDMSRRLRERDDEDWRRDLHDLKNLLQPVASYLELLSVTPGFEDDALLASARAALATGAAGASDRSARPLIHPARADAVADDIRSIVSIHANARPDVSFRHDAKPAKDDAMLAYNGRAMTRIISNLIMNSFSHAWPDERDDARIDIAYAPIDTGWRFGYRDNGVGLPEPITSAFEDDVGGGLGLQSIHRLAQGAGWDIAFVDTKGGGVHAIVDLPYFSG